jgi:hypothetical protein
VYVRVVRFSDVSAERIEGLLARIRESDGPPPGVPSTGLKVLYSLSNQIGETGPLTDAQKESVALAQSTCSSLLEITRQVLDRPEPPLPAA